MKNDSSTQLRGCLVVLITLVMAPLLYLENGWVLSILWQWFIVPFGLPSLSIPYAIGIAIVVGFLTSQVNQKAHTDDRDELEKLADYLGVFLTAAISPLVSLGVGYIVSRFL